MSNPFLEPVQVFMYTLELLHPAIKTEGPAPAEAASALFPAESPEEARAVTDRDPGIREGDLSWLPASLSGAPNGSVVTARDLRHAWGTHGANPVYDARSGYS